VNPAPDLTLVVLLFASLAAATAVLGVGPFVLGRAVPVTHIGLANAVAAGMMLGAAYGLLVAGLALGKTAVAAGAALGILFVAGTHSASGTEDLDLNRLNDRTEAYGYQVLLVNSLHAASEGVAIGAAMAVSQPFGIFMALAIAVHNIPEATVLCAILRGRGVSVPNAAGLAFAANVGQILLAVVAYAVIAAAPGLLPWALGFAVGALIQLTMTELLPESYHQTGSRSIALATIVAMGIVVFMRGFAG
jgi:zinc transporter, ZIP family